jgi:diguanylate cyclase (GGDEF)-like protein
VSRLWNLARRHRFSVQDLTLLAAFMLVLGFVAFEVDVYEHEGEMTIQEETLELNEVLSLGAVLSIGLLIFATRRYREQKRETQRRIAAEAHARELAFQDVLTGLPNRRQFDDALKAAIVSPPRAGASHALLLLDLNGFKQVNDVHGHNIGDELLIIVAQRLLAAVRQGDLVARFGGDEFAVLSLHLSGAEAATNIARRILQGLEQPVTTGKATHRIGAGIGIAMLPGDADTVSEAFRKADVALYRAKAERRSAMRFFEPEMDRHVHERAQMEGEIRAAIAAGRILPCYQPSVNLRTKKVSSFEAVPRWIHDTLGEIPPDRFIPIAEDVGLIHELAERILRAACVAAAQWPADVSLSIDIYPSQLKDQELKPRTLRILAEAGVSPHRLEVEITESAIVRDLEAAQSVLSGLRAEGVRIALDNFGTGYSSLYHLRNFKLDKIKIDRSFVASMTTQRESAEIVSALVGLGQGLGLTVTAEGIEGADQQASLLGTGCEEGQGQMFSQPVSAADTLMFFRESA